MIARITRAYSKVGASFLERGGSTRHFVLECFVPALETENLHVPEPAKLTRLIRAADRKPNAHNLNDANYIESLGLTDEIQEAL